jgi:hypothetical protein
MPLLINDDTPITFPKAQYLTLDKFNRGVITLIDKSRLPKNALEAADNIFLYEDGMPGPRPGVNWFGTAVPNAMEIDGYDYFDFNGVIHLVAVAGGNVYRSTNDGTTWSLCSGATTTSGNPVEMNQNGGYLYLTNGVDNTIRYDGTTTLQTYTSIATPAAPTATKTGLAATTYPYHYKASAVNQVGFTIASPKGSVSVSTTRDTWDATSNFVTVTGTVSTSATRVDIYISEDDLDYFYLGSTIVTAGTGAFSFKDDGTAIVIPSTKAPTANTTQGEKYEELVNVGSRQYGIRNQNNRYRIGFTGTGTYSGAFSSAYDGGYLDWQQGGKLVPVKVVDYRDGKGTPLATIWCDSADGQGGILQMTLDTLTIGDVSVTVPSAYLLPGSRGTPAPGSVVNVLNDYMFYNSQAFYNLGSREQFLNLLSTDEASSNIRRTIKQITTSGEENIASVYFDAKVYFSVPYGSTANSHTIVFDTEQKAWLPTAFTLGFKKFLRYTDTTGTQRLLALKPGDTRLSEIGKNIYGDYGLPFTTNLLTGLYPTTPNRFDFQFTEEGEVEFSNPEGVINVELIGIERSRGFSTTNTETITTTLTNTGHSTFLHSTTLHSDTSDAPETFSESSVKRYFIVQRELNAVQWRVTTNTLRAKYVLRTLQSWGTETQAGKPRQWRIG